MGGIGFRLGGSPRRNSATVSCTQVSTPRRLYNLWTNVGTNCIFLVFLRRKKRGVTTENSLRPPGALDSSPIIGRTERAALRSPRRASPSPGRGSARPTLARHALGRGDARPGRCIALVERLAPKRARDLALLVQCQQMSPIGDQPAGSERAQPAGRISRRQVSAKLTLPPRYHDARRTTAVARPIVRMKIGLLPG
jgi:hypothetical protein